MWRRKPVSVPGWETEAAGGERDHLLLVTLTLSWSFCWWQQGSEGSSAINGDSSGACWQTVVTAPKTRHGYPSPAPLWRAHTHRPNPNDCFSHASEFPPLTSADMRLFSHADSRSLPDTHRVLKSSARTHTHTHTLSRMWTHVCDKGRAEGEHCLIPAKHTHSHTMCNSSFIFRIMVLDGGL